MGRQAHLEHELVHLRRDGAHIQLALGRQHVLRPRAARPSQPCRGERGRVSALAATRLIHACQPQRDECPSARAVRSTQELLRTAAHHAAVTHPVPHVQWPSIHHLAIHALGQACGGGLHTWAGVGGCQHVWCALQRRTQTARTSRAMLAAASSCMCTNPKPRLMPASGVEGRWLGSSDWAASGARSSWSCSARRSPRPHHCCP